MKPVRCAVEVRICAPDASARNIASSLTFFRPDSDDLVFRSALADDEPVSEHLKWLYGKVKFDRKVFRQLETSGVTVVVRIRVHDRQVLLAPEALLLMHRFHLTTEIQVSK